MSELFENLTVEHFINEVKRHPEIWNPASEDYHDRDKKKSSWISISRRFCDEFDQKNDSEKNEICRTMIKKWRNIKDNYVKSLKKQTKSGQGLDLGRPYIYTRQLQFLQYTGATAESQSSCGKEQAEDDLKQSEENKLSSTESERRHSHNLRKRKADADPFTPEFVNVDVPSSAATPEQNDDRSFFESILPFVSCFTEDQKLDFRCEVMNVIKRIRLAQQNTSEHRAVYSPECNVVYISPPAVKTED